MKQKLFSIILLLIILFSCSKHTKEEKFYKYLNEEKLLCYKNETDIDKLTRDLPKASITWLKFGDKVEILQEKEIKKEKYIQFKQNTTNTFWGKSASFIDKFVVILKDNIKLFNSPDASDDSSILSQVGDYGIQIKESPNGFVLVDFKGYHPFFLDGEQKYTLGQKWIKTNNKNQIFTNNSAIAREAYFLSWAHYYENSKNDILAAIKKLKLILQENTNTQKQNPITLMAQDYLKKLENLIN